MLHVHGKNVCRGTAVTARSVGRGALALAGVLGLVWPGVGRAARTDDPCKSATAREAEASDRAKAALVGSVAREAAEGDVRAAQMIELEACKKRQHSESTEPPAVAGATKKTRSAGKPAPPAPPRPTASFETDDQRRNFGRKLAEEARRALARIDTRLEKEREACKQDSACLQALQELEDARLSLAVQSLSLSVRWSDDGIAEARRLLTSVIYASDDQLDRAVRELIARTRDSKEASKFVFQMSDLLKDAGERTSVGLRLALASKVTDDETRGAIVAYFRRLKAAKHHLPEALSRELDKPQPDPTILTQAIQSMNQADAERLFAAVDSLARAQDAIKTHLANVQGRMLVVLRAPPSGSCDLGVHFRAELLRAMTTPEKASTGQVGIMVVEGAADSKQFQKDLDAAACFCGRAAGCRPQPAFERVLARDASKTCEAVIGVELDPTGGGQVTPRGRLRFLRSDSEGGSSFSPPRLNPFVGTAFSDDCQRDVEAEQGAARDFFATLVDGLVAIWSAGSSPPPEPWKLNDGQAPPFVEQPSRARALLLSGFPQLSDGDPDNNSVGWALAGADLGLCLTGAGLIGASVFQRNDAVGGMDRASARWSDRLVVSGQILIGAALVERFVAMILYHRPVRRP
jgi:hypothetical protein